MIRDRTQAERSNMVQVEKKKRIFENKYINYNIKL